MLNRFKTAFYSVVNNIDTISPEKLGDVGPNGEHKTPLKYAYTRPHFLQLNGEDEIQVAGDHLIRPIIVPRDITRLPWNAGYAEWVLYLFFFSTVFQTHNFQSVINDLQGLSFKNGVYMYKSSSIVHNANCVFACSLQTPAIDVQVNVVCTRAVNAGKSLRNEDQGRLYLGYLERYSENGPEEESLNLDIHTLNFTETSPKSARQRLPYIYFALFDGHAGTGAALSASHELHRILHVTRFWLSIFRVFDHLWFIQEKLMEVIDHLLPPTEPAAPPPQNRNQMLFFPEKEISVENFVVGALESAFHIMVKQDWLGTLLLAIDNVISFLRRIIW